MKHDRLAGSRKTANHSRDAATEKVLSHYDLIPKNSQHLQGANLRFHNALDIEKNRKCRQTSYVPDAI